MFEPAPTLETLMLHFCGEIRRAINKFGNEAKAAFTKIGVLMASARRTAQALHPTNLHVNKALFPRDTIQSRLPNPEWLEQWLDKQINFDAAWESKEVAALLAQSGATGGTAPSAA